MEMNPVLTIGAEAPDFLLRDIDGHPHALSHYRGQLVVLNFWSAECPWSKRADEAMAQYARDWGNQLVWISIAPNANESAEDVRAEAAARGLPLVLMDPARELTERYGAETTPHLFVIDPSGRLRYQGAFDDVQFRQPEPTRHYLKDAVDALLAGGEPEETITPAYGCTIVYYKEG